jgi:copper chaperone
MIDLKVEGMMCNGCAGTVEKAVKRVDPNASVSIDLPTGRVSIETDKDAKAISEAIEAAGYDVAA